jgi:hypothetical protein
VDGRASRIAPVTGIFFVLRSGIPWQMVLMADDILELVTVGA